MAFLAWSGSWWWLSSLAVPGNVTLVCVSALGEPQNSCLDLPGTRLEISPDTRAGTTSELVHSYSDYSVNWNTVQHSKHNMMQKESQKRESRFLSIVLWCRGQIIRDEKHSCFTDFTLHKVDIYCLNSLGRDSEFHSEESVAALDMLK